MTYQGKVNHDIDQSIAISESPAGLRAIKEPGCAAAIWHREPMPSLQSWLDGLCPDDLPKARLILRPAMVCDALQEIADAYGLPESEERRILIEDVSALAAMFADVMQTPYLRMRLDVINTNMCRKFHIDAVAARLICTYRGTGTQYGISANGGDPDQVFTVATGSPIILRGTRWPAAPRSGLLHRSPPIEGSGETRLMLVLDPVAVPEDEPEYIH